MKSFMKFKTMVSILTGVLVFIALLPALLPVAVVLALLIRAKILKLYKLNIEDLMTVEVPNEVNEVRTISEKGQRAVAESLIKLMEGEEEKTAQWFCLNCQEVRKTYCGTNINIGNNPQTEGRPCALTIADKRDLAAAEGRWDTSYKSCEFKLIAN